MMRSVLFALEWLPTYRLEFFDHLRRLLSEIDVAVEVVHGQPPTNKSTRGTDAGLEWASYQRNRRVSVAGTEFCWQPVVRRALSADLVVVQQESSLLLNALLAVGIRRNRPWAMWGHGQHFNPHESSRIGERLKFAETRRASWFFAYTDQSRNAVVDIGFPPDRVTVVNNSLAPADIGIPTPSIRAIAAEAKSRSQHIGLMASSLDRWKRLDFLMEAADSIRHRLPDFEFFVLGSGERFDDMQAWSRERSWAHVLGPVFGADKAAIAEVCDIMLHPGLVGLHVVEAFQLGTPMITTDIDYHSHEVSYLESGVNGLEIGNDPTPSQYADAAIELFGDPLRLAALRNAGFRRAEQITIESMAERFASGVEAALDQ